MLRGSGIRRSSAIIAGAAVLLLTACGSQATNDVLEELDPPQIDYIEDENELEVEVIEGDITDEGEVSSITDESMEENETEEAASPEEKGGEVTVQGEIRELYLLDSNGMVAPQSVEVISEEDELTALAEHLVQEGPVTENLPNGFQASLPAGTEVLSADLNEQGVATINFNDYFGEYHPAQEMQVLQSLTWTLTQLDDVDKVSIQINGEDLTAMPHNDTPIGDGYTRAHGINLEMTDQTDLVSTEPVVVYFLNQTEDQTYYVPVTRRISQEEDKYQAVINELLEGPHYMSELLTDFRQEVELIEEPEYHDGTVVLNFNEALLSQHDGTALSENVLNMIVLSLTEQEEVNSVSFMVESEEEIMVSNGEALSEAVVRPDHVNIGQF
jgi:germination protein M